MRRPPMLGLVGVDFGTKPAICFALEKRTPWEEYRSRDTNRDGFVDDGDNPPPTCPALTLVCDSISASKSKCGHRISAGGGNCYLHKTTKSGACAALDAYSSSVSCNNYYWSRHDVFTPCPGLGTGSIGAVTQVTGCSGTSEISTVTCDGDKITRSGVDYDCDAAASDFAHNYTTPFSDWIEESTLSAEYTTALLITDTEDALPDYFGFGAGTRGAGQSTTCSSTLALATDETSYSIRRFQHKWTFAAPATVACTIGWNEHFVPTVGSPVDTARTTSVSAGDTETDVFEVLEPSTNGTTTITDVTCEVV